MMRDATKQIGLPPQVLNEPADVTARLPLIISERLRQLEEVPEDSKTANYTYLQKSTEKDLEIDLQARQVHLSTQ